MKVKLRDISYNLTWYCLASCKYCSICRQQELVHLDEELAVTQIEKLFSDPILDYLTTIHITGGEPSLTPKMFYLVDILAKYHQDVPMNTPISGLYPYLMERLWIHIHKKIPQFRCDLAVEGPTKEVHERVRGIDTWEPAMLTLEKLKKIGVPMQFEMTVYKENHPYIVDTYNFAMKNKVGFYLNFGRWSRRFGHSTDGFIFPSEEEQKVIWEQVDQIGWKNWRPLNKQKYELQKAYWARKDIHFDCLMGLRSIDVNPFGDVYPCLMYPKGMCLGNIKTKTLSEMFASEDVKQILERIKKRTCQPCPFTCVVHAKNLKVS